MGFIAIRNVRSGYRQKRPAWGIANTMRNLDNFGRDTPQFNLRGENQVNTVYGGVVTIMIFALALIYSSIKAVELVDRSNPQIS